MASGPGNGLCRRLVIAFALIVLVGLPMAWLVRAIQFQGIGSISASLNFPTVAMYRLFEEAGLPVPGILPFHPDQGSMVGCLRDGQPNSDLRQDQFCKSEIYWSPKIRRACDSLSSYWGNEVCLAAGMPDSFLLNPRFLAILREYARDPCEYVRNYDRIVAPAFARRRGGGTETFVAGLIRRDFGCDEGSAGAPGPSRNPDLWRKIRLFMLFENAEGRVLLQTELLLRL